MPGIHIFKEKDFTSIKSKSNGYPLPVVEVETLPDCYGKTPGSTFIEVQLRTIAMDSGP